MTNDFEGEEEQLQQKEAEGSEDDEGKEEPEQVLLRTSPCLSPYLPASPCISLYLPIASRSSSRTWVATGPSPNHNPNAAPSPSPKPEQDMGGELDEENQEVVDEKLWDKEEDDLKPQATP